jgi:hypothetical protein
MVAAAVVVSGPTAQKQRNPERNRGEGESKRS